MSMLKICGQELELDLFDADTMEVYEKSMDKVVKRAEESRSIRSCLMQTASGKCVES